ncbi:glycosyltransferase [Enterococcus sp. LJL99]
MICLQKREGTNKKPLLYFAMGSSSNKKMILSILEILKTMPILVIAPVKMYLSETEIEIFNKSNIYLFDWISATEIGKSIDLSFIHGGEGTIQTAYLSGKPFLGIGLQIEQKANLKMFQDFGNAIVLKKINARLIKDSIERLLTDSIFSEKAIMMKCYMEKSNGSKRAAAFIIDLLNCL